MAFNSLTTSNTLTNNSAVDILRQVQGMAVSPDQKWMAMILNGSYVAVTPLVNGIPDLTNVRVVNTGTEIASGRDITFDAADNIQYVSSGQGLYRVLATVGTSRIHVSPWNGSSLRFRPVRAPLFWDINGTAARPVASNASRGIWDGTAMNFNTDSTGGSAGSLIATTVGVHGYRHLSLPDQDGTGNYATSTFPAPQTASLGHHLRAAMLPSMAPAP